MCCLKALVAIIVLIIFAIINWWHNTHTDYGPLRDNYFKWTICVEKFSDDLDDNKYWEQIEFVANDCERLLGITDSRLKGFSNADWEKFHLMPRKQERNEDSLILSAGVGHDIVAEHKLKPLLTLDSLFIVFDPDISNGADYAKIGLYCPRMVGNRSGDFDLTYKMFNGTIITGPVNMITITELLASYIPKRTEIIDNLWIDLEYSQLDVLEKFRAAKEAQNQEDSTLCQFNIKINAPQTADEKTQFRQFLTGLMEDGRYAFLKMTLFKDTWRVFFLDFIDTRCADRYLLPE